MDNNSFKITPSLVINVTDKCNMNCIYCPPYGENLCRGKDTYDINAVRSLIRLAKQNQFKTVRFTGGEPLLESQRLQELLKECGTDFQRLRLNSNGVLLNKNFGWLEKYKDKCIIKISLDSIDVNEFGKLTRSYFFNKVIDNLTTSIDLEFKIEVNTVLVNQSLDSIKRLIEYTTGKKIPVKLLTLSNYYGMVENTLTNFDIDGLLNYLNTISETKTNEHLSGNRGISMLNYTVNNTTILLVDHSCTTSKTPIKIYFYDCKKTCSLFPCASGALSISLSTDGLISICRGRKDLGVNVFNESESTIAENFKLLLNRFDNCIEINVNNI
jgi:cyclic pyranopterin phosphate synthase